jgi:hypothetical protein
MTDEVIDAPVETGDPIDPVVVDPKAPVVGDKPLAAGGGDDKPIAVPVDWPEDWRDKMSAKDADALKALERYKSPADVAKALREAQKKISSGQQRPALPKDATEEQIAEFRKEIGVPDKPEGYLDALPNGLVIGENDKAIAGSFLAAAHASNMPPEHVGEALGWYYTLQEETASAEAQYVKDFRMKSQDELRAEWGPEFRGNINSGMALLDTAPVMEDGTPFKNAMMGARLEDGSLMGDHPDFLRWIVGLASSANPAGFVSPSGSGSQIESVQDEIASIEKIMREDRRAYDKDEKMQARLRMLYTAEEKLSAK